MKTVRILAQHRSPKLGTTLLGLFPSLRLTAKRGSLPKNRHNHCDAVTQSLASRRRRLPYSTEFNARRTRQIIPYNKPVSIHLPNGSTVIQAAPDHKNTFACLEGHAQDHGLGTGCYPGAGWRWTFRALLNCASLPNTKPMLASFMRHCCPILPKDCRNYLVT